MSFGDKNFTYGPRIVKDGLVFYIDAANPKSYVSGDTTTNDLVSSSVGTLENGVGFSIENNGAWSFDGSDEYINVQSVNAGTNSTISYWFKGGTNTNHTLLGEDDNQFDYVIQLATGTGQIAFRVGTKYSTWVGITELSDNAWHHYAFVRSSTSADLYVDGSLKTKTVNGTYDGTATTFHVIGAQGNFQFEITGDLSNFQTYNKALTAAEVLQNYNALKGRFGL